MPAAIALATNGYGSLRPARDRRDDGTAGSATRCTGAVRETRRRSAAASVDRQNRRQVRLVSRSATRPAPSERRRHPLHEPRVVGEVGLGGRQVGAVDAGAVRPGRGRIDEEQHLVPARPRPLDRLCHLRQRGRLLRSCALVRTRSARLQRIPRDAHPDPWRPGLGRQRELGRVVDPGIPRREPMRVDVQPVGDRRPRAGRRGHGGDERDEERDAAKEPTRGSPIGVKTMNADGAFVDATFRSLDGSAGGATPRVPGRPPKDTSAPKRDQAVAEGDREVLRRRDPLGGATTVVVDDRRVRYVLDAPSRRPHAEAPSPRPRTRTGTTRRTDRCPPRPRP